MKDSINDVKKNNHILIIMIVFAVLLVGGTLAYLVLGITATNDKYNTVTSCLEIDYDITNDDGSIPITGTMFPSKNATGGLNGKVGLKINDSCSLEGVGTLSLNVVNSSATLIQEVNAHCENSKTLETLTDLTSSACTSNGDNIWVTNGSALKYAVYDTNNITDSVLPVSVGYVNKTGQIDIYSGFPVTKTNVNYYIYIWLDGHVSDNSYAGLSFAGNISSSAVQKSKVLQIAFDLQGGEIQESFTTVGEHIYRTPYAGNYRLEVWGAQGGGSVANGALLAGDGYGGYAVGTIELDAGKSLYINVGGKGTDGIILSDAPGGYNGGGSGTSDGSDDEASGGGGGATHIAIVSGVLSTLQNNINDILIVAGGGGGKSFSYSAGSGGGYNGGITNNTSSVFPTQIDGYSFGKGQDASGIADSDGVGGGGGGLYGGYSNNVSASSSGTGGSGYIGNSLLTNRSMYCYNCTTSDDVNTLTYTTTNVSSEITPNYAKSGDGGAQITVVDMLVLSKLIGEAYGELPLPTKNGNNFLGWNTKSDGTGVYVTIDSIVSSNVETLYAIWE